MSPRIRQTHTACEPGARRHQHLMLVIKHNVDGTEQRFSRSMTESRARSTFLRGNTTGLMALSHDGLHPNPENPACPFFVEARPPRLSKSR